MSLIGTTWKSNEKRADFRFRCKAELTLVSAALRQAGLRWMVALDEDALNPSAFTAVAEQLDGVFADHDRPIDLW